MALAKDIIQSMNRAIRAEEKQGHINTGALGSFSDYLLDICSDFGNFYAADRMADYLKELKILAEKYKEASPYQRRSILLGIKQLLSKMEVEQNKDNVDNTILLATDYIQAKNKIRKENGDIAKSGSHNTGQNPKHL